MTAVLLAAGIILLPFGLRTEATDASFTGTAAARSTVSSATLSPPGTLACTEDYVLLVGTRATVSWPAPTTVVPNTQYKVTVTQGSRNESYLVPGAYSTTFSPGLLGLGGLLEALVSGSATVSVQMVAIDPTTGAATWASAASTRGVRVVLPVLGLIGGFYCS